MLELLLALAVLSVALLYFGGAVGATARQRVILRENAIAREGARAFLETLRSVDFATVYASYNENPADDPGGANTAPGPRFLVPGLEPLPTAVDGLQGEVLFPEIDLGAGVWELREDVVDRPLGMPRDLDGDAKVDDEDHATDYFILPVRVRLRWMGSSGPRVLDTYASLCEINRA